ncbi:MAG: S41 family peptidase [Planctomycetes bacterium]|nr:S41 family peptidase [Planctomycetota bacterium]
MRMNPRRSWSVSLLFAGLILFPQIVAAYFDNKLLEKDLLKASALESDGQWDKACDLYEAILRDHRNAPGLHAKYQHALRRFWQNRRHDDINFRKEVLSLSYGQALKLHAMIRDTLLDNSLDRKKVDPARIFQKGLEEFDFALADKRFRELYLPGFKEKDDEIKAFREFVKRTWGAVVPTSRDQAEKLLREIAINAQNALQIPSTISIMEFACGACYAFDDYTFYLTPIQLRELCDSLRGGELVGVGLTLRSSLDGKVTIGEIAPLSPAEKSGKLAAGDIIIAIDRKPVAMLMVEAVQDLLQGTAGANVELEVLRMGMAMPYVVTLQRRGMFTPSVQAHVSMAEEDIGYLHISSFQETTVQEVDAVLAGILANVKVLILDLRGNSGGVFEAAIDVARRFIANGVIASTQNTDPKLNAVYQSRNPNALAIPLVVLIDGETASAAEVLVGALKDHKRAWLVGQTTFGKGCTQCVLKLPSVSGNSPSGGLRLTVARFFSPEGLPYTGRGVTPDHFSTSDDQERAALDDARRLLKNEK